MLLVSYTETQVTMVVGFVPRTAYLTDFFASERVGGSLDKHRGSTVSPLTGRHQTSLARPPPAEGRGKGGSIFCFQ